MFGRTFRRPSVLLLAALAFAACKRGAPGVAAGTGGNGGRAGGPGGSAGAAAAGAVGTGGSGDVTGIGGAASAGWNVVPEAAPCVLEAAVPAQVDVLPLVWSACGTGCRTSPSKVLPTDQTVYNGIATARVVDGDVHVRFGTSKAVPAVSNASDYKLIATRRLSDGALLGAVRAPGPTSASCAMMGFAASAPSVLPFAKPGPTGLDGISSTATIVGGLIRAGKLAWSTPAADLPSPQTSVFENDLGWGMALNDGTLRVAIPPESGLRIIDEGAVYPAHSAVGWGSLVVSNPALAGNQDEVIRAWEPNRSSRTIVAMPDTDIPSVALSATTMVWTGVHGPRRWDGTYTAAELYWTPFPAGKDTVPLLGGTPLPSATHGLMELQTWGDYAATWGVPEGADFAVLIVVRMSDQRVWTIRKRPGARLKRLLAVTPAEILVGENDDTGDPALEWHMQHLTRYELAHLDALAAAW
jgi:hypothetical protein